MLLTAAVEPEEEEKIYNDQHLSSDIYKNAIDIHSNKLYR